MSYLNNGCQVAIWPPPLTIKQCPLDHFLRVFFPPVSLLQGSSTGKVSKLGSSSLLDPVNSSSPLEIQTTYIKIQDLMKLKFSIL